MAYFSGAFAVSFREGKLRICLKHKTVKTSPAQNQQEKKILRLRINMMSASNFGLFQDVGRLPKVAFLRILSPVSQE